MVDAIQSYPAFHLSPGCGDKMISPPPRPIEKNYRKSDSAPESTTTTSTSGDISSAKEAVVFMGFPEPLVQLAIDIQRLDHGTDFTDATQLYLVVDDITKNPLKQAELAKKLFAHAEKGQKKKIEDTVPVKFKEETADEKPVPRPAEVPDKQASPDKAEKLQERVKTLAKENQKLKKRKMCRACKKVELATSGITFLPCGHFITCETCSEMFDDCPACGKNIMGTVRTFLS